MSADFQTGNLTEWANGQPVDGIYNGAVNTGNLTFWMDGQPYQTIYPLSNWGDFFFFINM